MFKIFIPLFCLLYIFLFYLIVWKWWWGWYEYYYYLVLFIHTNVSVYLCSVELFCLNTDSVVKRFFNNRNNDVFTKLILVRSTIYTSSLVTVKRAGVSEKHVTSCTTLIL